MQNSMREQTHFLSEKGMQMNIGLIGAGKVGCSLGKYLTEKGVPIVGYYSQNHASTQQAADFTASKAFSSATDLAAACDLLFLTVPDDAIVPVWHQIRACSLEKMSIGHCSGALSSSVLDGIAAKGAMGFSLHPLLAVRDKITSWKEMHQVYFTLEGDPLHLAPIASLLHRIGNPYAVIAPENKVRYHAACVTVSNLVIGLAKMGADMFASCGLDDAFAQQAWHKMFLNNAEGICSVGFLEALTGPVERGDAHTVRQHMQALDGDTLQIYRHLSLILLEIAQEKHADRSYSELKKELDL